jgi:NAD(P)-dependent dehydrogenase (short-subunit alcohol dehydrogenase family)
MGTSAAAHLPKTWLISQYCDRIRVVALDVTDDSAARAAVQTAIDEFGSLDVVVNSAGASGRRDR